MAYDGLINYSIVKELKNKIINGKIDKIFQPNFDEILLGIYCNGIKYALDLNVNPKYYRANLTTNTKPNPSQAPNFCMTLRKYLLGTHISDIYTINLERIIFIEFDGYSKSNDFSRKKLIIELMGKYSNIILVDSKDIIIESLKHFSVNSGAIRNIYSGAKYILPSTDKLDFMSIRDKEDFYQILNNNAIRYQSNSLSYLISNTFTGICQSSMSSFQSDLDISDTFDTTSSAKLFEYIYNTINMKNVICKNHVDDYSLSIISTPKKNDLQINFFLDDYYTKKERNFIFLNYRNNLLKLVLTKLNKLNNKLDNVNIKINECKDAEKYKLYGELIISNLYRINDYNTNSITLENYYDNNKLITIDLDGSISPSLNAKKFFKKYKKLKSAQDFINVQKQSIVNDINYLESITYKINSAKDIVDIDEIYNEIKETNISLNKKKQNKNKKSSIQQNILSEPLKYFVDGFTILVGKNDKQNDYLTTRLANNDDIWFHVKDFHGSHVILKTENRIPSPEVIYKCANIAKEHSEARQSSNVSIDYTFIKYVKKPSKSKTGMVIYTNNKTINI